MQPTATLDIKRSGDLGGHKVAMKFDENSIAHIMSVLTDLYSDAEMAIIREYSTNAWDSHVASGQTRPIEVETPSNLSPFFRIRDFGLGMDLTDIENIYSQYGASTKRETNEQTGMLGLGCKSALTYTNQFTLIATKNGVKTSVMISRVEDGTGVMEVLFQKPTDEPNGVEVVIPVRYSTSFDNKVNQFFENWVDGTVLLNGKAPEFLPKSKRIGSSDIYMVPGDGKDMVVMGNVAYPVDAGLAGEFGGYYKKFRVIAFVPIGSFNFTPSREALHYTPRTNETIVKVRTEFKESLAKTVQANIDAAPDNSAAIERYFEWTTMLSRMPVGITYKGQVIETEYRVPEGFHIWDRSAYRSAMKHNTKSVGYREFMKMLVVTGFDFEKVTITQRNKVSLFIEGMEDKPRYVAFVQGDKIPGAPWTNGVTVVPYAEIKALRIAREPREKRTAKYDVLNDSGYTVETDDIDDSQNIYFFSPKSWKDATKNLVQLFPDDILVSIGENRHAKFMRDFPNAKPLNTALMRKRLLDIRGTLSVEDVIYLSLDRWSRNNLLKFDYEKFADPELSTYVKAASVKPTGNVALFNNTVARLNAIGHYGWNEMTVQKISSPFDAYPLVGRMENIGPNVTEHIYMYCNAVYTNKEN